MASTKTAAYAGKLVAVLEFGGIGIESSVLEKLSDTTRVASRNVLPKSEYDLMTRENMVQILQDNEIDPNCIEGACEVETGRNIGADLIISGDVMNWMGNIYCHSSFMKPKAEPCSVLMKLKQQEH